MEGTATDIIDNIKRVAGYAGTHERFHVKIWT